MFGINSIYLNSVLCLPVFCSLFWFRFLFANSIEQYWRVPVASHVTTEVLQRLQYSPKCSWTISVLLCREHVC